MNVVAEAQRLAGAGRRAEGVALVERAAAAGDQEALLALAYWRLYGVEGPRDPAAAHELLDRAASLGSLEAARLRAALSANGTGCASDPGRARGMLEALAASDAAARAQVDLLDAMDEGRRQEEQLCVDPPLRLVRALFSAQECGYLIEAATPAMRPSVIIDPVTRRPRPDPLRTSDGTNFGPAQEDPVIHALNRRIAAATGTLVECGEPLHILRYSPGQQYRPHLDAVPGASNQRVLTALVYLNEGYEGGETAFPELDIAAKGGVGDALLFANVGPDGRTDQRTRHAGLPIEAGVKWLATRWIRARPYDPFAPG